MCDNCPFCGPDNGRIWLKSEMGMVLWDAFPVTDGHSLVIPMRHVTGLYELSAVEQDALWQLVREARQQLIERLDPDGFNIGLNDGTAAGQTVMHAHVHIIPRRRGDVPDPRGGVRWIFSDAPKYWNRDPR